MEMNDTIAGVLKVFYFVVVFGLIIFFAYFVSRMIGRRGRFNTGKYMKVIDSLYLGTDKMLLIIQVGTEYMLVSAGSKDISLIKTLDSFAVEEEVETPFEQSGFTYYLERYGKNYKNSLQKLRGKKNNSSNRDGINE